MAITDESNGMVMPVAPMYGGGNGGLAATGAGLYYCFYSPVADGAMVLVAVSAEISSVMIFLGS